MQSAICYRVTVGYSVSSYRSSSTVYTSTRSIEYLYSIVKVFYPLGEGKYRTVQVRLVVQLYTYTHCSMMYDIDTRTSTTCRPEGPGRLILWTGLASAYLLRG